MLPPTDDELYQYSCLIEDVDTLAIILNVSRDQLEEIKQEFPNNKQAQAFQLLKKWHECTKSSCQDLSQLLKSKQKRFFHCIITLHYTYLLALMKGSHVVAYSDKSDNFNMCTLLKKLLLPCYTYGWGS